MAPGKVGWVLLHLLLLTACCPSTGEGERSESCEDLGTKNSHFECTDTGEVRCSDGWSGEECDEPICKEGCDPIHGFCTRPGECRCSLGWRGELCTECTPLPGCQHGFCNSTSFECICEPGWDGLFCSQPICKDGCHSTRGYCDIPGECKCRIGWGGDTCEECKPLPGCINGFCTKPLECRCEEGWTGLFCQTPICAQNCSKDHGTCVQPGECRCDIGWWGENCDTCFPYPGCKKGTCYNPWECVCDPGWKGMLCDERDDIGFCASNPDSCLNGGTCIDVPPPRNFTCSCPSLFTGQRCDYLADLSQSPLESPPFTFEESLTEAVEGEDEEDREETAESAGVQVLRQDSSSPLGSYSLLQPTPTPLRPASRMNLTKDERRIHLQNTARISFRKPKLVSAADKSGKLPFTVIERKLLPLPVFLPRVSEIIPGEDGPIRLLKPLVKDPTPILVLEAASSDQPPAEEDNLVKATSESDRASQASFEDAHSTTAPRDENQLNENRRFIRHQEGGPDPSQVVAVPAESQGPQQRTSGPSQPRAPPSKLVRIRNRPLLVSAQASALPRPNPVSPATLRTRNPSLQPQTPASSKPTTTPATTTTTSGPLTTRPREEEKGTPDVPPGDAAVPESRSLESEAPATYYEQNSNGRVHIGDVSEVDEGAPHDEIFEAFIELKKVT